MKSPYGQRGEICAKFGWTWSYLHTEIPWRVVVRMMADCAWFDDEKEAKNEDDVIDFEKMTPEDAAKLQAMFSGQ